MAKTRNGKKIVHVRSYIRSNPDGREIVVKRHCRSTPNKAM